MKAMSEGYVGPTYIRPGAMISQPVQPHYLGHRATERVFIKVALPHVTRAVDNQES